MPIGYDDDSQSTNSSAVCFEYSKASGVADGSGEV